MPQTRTASSDFTRAFGDVKKQASGIAGDAADAAQDLYGHARDSASELADSTTKAEYWLVIARFVGRMVSVRGRRVDVS